MQRYRVVNLLGQITPAQVEQAKNQVRRQNLPCPPLPAVTPELSCVATRDGGVICSDGTYFPPGCPAPELTEAGMAPYQQKGGFLVLEPPPERSLTEEVGSGMPILPLVIAVASLVGTIIFS